MQARVEHHVVRSNGELYCTQFWQDLIALIDPEKSKEFTCYEGKIPLQLMVDYTQATFLRSDSNTIPATITDFLAKQGHMQAQPFAKKVDYALFLGMTIPVNLFKRAFFLFDAIVKDNVAVDTVVILGNNEPFAQHRELLQRIIDENPGYFRSGTAIPDSLITMQQVMEFIIDSLNWPEGKLPKKVILPLSYPCNTNAEAAAVVDYLAQKTASSSPQFFPQKRPQVVTLTHQPYVDRQGITVSLAAKKARLNADFFVAGCGTKTYPALELRDSLNARKLIEEFSKLLYEINQNRAVILEKSTAEVISNECTV